MKRIGFYLSGMFFTRWLMTAFGMITLAGLLDSLANASQISASDQGGALRYMTLRLPVIFDLLFLFSLMLAILLTYVSLIRRNELVALQAAGLSSIAQIKALFPIVLLISGLSLFAIDRTLPSSVQALNDWGIGEYKGGNVSSDAPLWINDNDLFVRIESRENLQNLKNLTLFQRNADGYIQRVTWADTARYDGSVWRLENISTMISEGLAFIPPPMEVWETRQNPVLIDKLAADPRNLSIKDLRQFSTFSSSGSRPSAAYRVWLVKRLILPVSALALLFLAVPIMQRLGRRDSGTAALIIGVGITFLFLILDGIMVTMGGAGALTPALAALIASLLLGCGAAYLWLKQELMEA